MTKALAPATRDYTVVLHKACHRIQFKKKAPKAIKVIREMARKNMQTEVEMRVTAGCQNRRRPQPVHLEQRNQKHPQEG